MASPDIVERGQDPTELKRFAEKTRPYWERAICGRCSGNGSRERCRPHLLEDAAKGEIGDSIAHLSLLDYVVSHMRIYERSFRYEFQDTETDEDMAALISAVGWCSGWKPFLLILA